MSNSINIDAYKRLLSTEPTMAELLGVETRELSHNRFIDSILRDSRIGHKYLSSLVEGGSPGVVNSIQNHVISNVAFQPHIGKRLIPDEIVELKNTVSGSLIYFVFELKVEASWGLEQLSKYCLQQKEKNPESDVVGVLLRLNTSKGMERNVGEWGGEIARVGIDQHIRALESVGGSGAEIKNLSESENVHLVSSDVIQNYTETCRRLRDRDVFVVDKSKELWALQKFAEEMEDSNRKDSPYSKEMLAITWWQNNRDWCIKRYLSEVYSYLAKMDDRENNKQWGEVYMDAGSCHLSFMYCGGSDKIFVSENGSDGPLLKPTNNPKENIQAFFRLKLYKYEYDPILELQTIVDPYRGASKEAKTSRKEYEESLRRVITKNIEWSPPNRQSSMNHASGSVAKRSMEELASPKSTAEKIVELAEQAVRVLA